MPSPFACSLVQILKVIKGARRLGECKVVTIYAMEPGDSYLLYSLGGLALGADFLALAELSVIPLPKSFELKELDGRNATQQVEHVFSRRLFALENELRPLHYEQSLLKKGLQERTDDLFASRLPVEIEKIHEGATEDTGRGPAYLDLQGKKLAWSQQEPGKTGYFYFRGGLNSETFFEFAPSTATSIEAFRNKPLNGRFYGAYTPGREDAFAWVGPDSITVSVGQVILVRSASDPSTVFIVRLVRQSEQREAGMLTFNYAVARR